MHHARIATASSVALAIATLAPLAQAGLVGGGGSHDWTGSANSSWHNPANWTTGQVPGNDSAAIVVGGAPTVLLDGDSANLSTLFIGAGRAVSTNGHLLRTRMSSATTTVNGADAQLFVANHGAALAFDAGTLAVSNGGLLSMAGGRARIVDQLTIAVGGSIAGHGSVEVESANAVAFNAFFADALTVFGGDLELLVTGGGAIALPAQIDVLQSGRILDIDAPLFSAASDINLGPDCAIDFSHDWTLAGAMSIVPGGTAEATVQGDGWMNVTGQIDVASERTLSVNARAHMLAGSSVAIDDDATLEFNDTHRANAGSSMDVSPGGVVRFNGPQIILMPWAGMISLSAATMETNSPSGLWISNGPMQLNSFAGVRSRIAGSATTRSLGIVDVLGHGVEVDNTFELALGADLNLANFWTSLVVNGTLNLGNSSTTGFGTIEIANGGQAFITTSATVAVDISNAGDLHLGSAPGAVGYKYVTGSFSQNATGRMVIDVAGPTAFDRDAWEFSGSTALDGTLDVQLGGGYVPTIGDEFEILWSNGPLTGAFASVAGAPGFAVS